MDYHHKCLGTERKIRAHEIIGSMCWESKTPEEIKEIRKKAGQTLKRRIKNNEIINGSLNILRKYLNVASNFIIGERSRGFVVNPYIITFM